MEKINMEFFEYIESSKSINAIEGIPMEVLKEIIKRNDTNAEIKGYKLKVFTKNAIIILDAKANRLRKVKCIKEYYDLTECNVKDQANPCGSIQEFIKEDISEDEYNSLACNTSNCSTCHLCAMNKFLNNKLIKL